MSRRTQIVVPTTLDKAIAEHMEKEGFSSWTQAMFDLVRKGLKSSVEERINKHD